MAGTRERTTARRQAGAEGNGRTSSKTGTRRTATATLPRSSGRAGISPEQRYRMIQEAAYYHAEKSSFTCDPWQCWLAAEQQIDTQLGVNA